MTYLWSPTRESKTSSQAEASLEMKSERKGEERERERERGEIGRSVCIHLPIRWRIIERDGCYHCLHIIQGENRTKRGKTKRSEEMKEKEPRKEEENRVGGEQRTSLSCAKGISLHEEGSCVFVTRHAMDFLKLILR